MKYLLKGKKEPMDIVGQDSGYAICRWTEKGKLMQGTFERESLTPIMEQKCTKKRETVKVESAKIVEK